MLLAATCTENYHCSSCVGPISGHETVWGVLTFGHISFAAFLCTCLNLPSFTLRPAQALGTSHVNELDSQKALHNLKAWVQHNPKYSGLEIAVDEYSDGTLMDEVGVKQFCCCSVNTHLHQNRDEVVNRETKTNQWLRQHSSCINQPLLVLYIQSGGMIWDWRIIGSLGCNNNGVLRGVCRNRKCACSPHIERTPKLRHVPPVDRLCCAASGCSWASCVTAIDQR